MDMREEITKMNLYKTFEPYIAKDITMENRVKGNIRLEENAPKEAKDALARWVAIKMKQRLF